MTTPKDINDIVYLKHVLKKAIAFKRKWDQRKLSHFEKNFGMCANTGLSTLTQDIRDYINEHYIHYSGDSTYPVPHPNYNPSFAYHKRNIKRYDKRTEYGRNRYQYLLVVIAVLSELINSPLGDSNESNHCRWT